jgi:hypothetical protein
MTGGTTVQRVFSRLTDGEIEDGGDIVSIGLLDSSGKEQRIFLSPDLLEDFGHALLVLRAAVERKQQAGIPPDDTFGGRFVAKAIPVDELRVDRPEMGALVLNFWTKSRARYYFSLATELVHQLRTRLVAS